jgi:hypothetical protein
MAVMECMHRFCDECISKSIRIGKKECPTCRVKCASRRSLRHDEALQDFITKVYPDRDDFEALNMPQMPIVPFSMPIPPPTRAPLPRRRRRAASESASEAPSETSPADVTTPDISDGDHASERARPRLRAPVRKRVAGPSAAAAAAEAALAVAAATAPRLGASQPARRATRPREIDVVLLTHPEETRLVGLEKPFLRTASQVTVAHLCKFLGSKLGRRTTQFQLSLDNGRGEVLLESDVSLDEMLHLVRGSVCRARACADGVVVGWRWK